eukprot:COSAG02_NODE_2840_length_7915_cov_7.736054_7_plen_52_part_00
MLIHRLRRRHHRRHHHHHVVAAISLITHICNLLESRIYTVGVTLKSSLWQR